MGKAMVIQSSKFYRKQEHCRRNFSKKERSISSSEDESAVRTTKNRNNTQLSEYEKQIFQNIEERKKMFQIIVGDAKKSFMELIPSKRKRNEKTITETSSVVKVPALRMSLRNKKQPDEQQSTKIHDEAYPASHRILLKRSWKQLKPEQKLLHKTDHLPLDQTYKDHESTSEDTTKLFQERIPLLEREGELEKLPLVQQEFFKTMRALKLTDEGIAKVVPNRVYSVAWHPSASKLLIAAGDRYGYIGFWDVDDSDKLQGVRSFKIHSLPVNCTTFDKFNPTRVITTSYDGYVRYFDLCTDISDPVYRLKRTSLDWTEYHAQRNSSNLLVSQSNGKVVMVDLRRRPGRAVSTIPCFDVCARTVSVHPTDDNIFMVCNRNGETGIFDLRYKSINKDDLAVPIMNFQQEKNGIHSAFFSPITGKYALVTNVDFIKLYDVTLNRAKARCINTLKHINLNESPISPYQAVWHPQKEDVFIIGSSIHPKRIGFYGAPDFQLLYNLSGENSASMSYTNAFHPTFPMMAGGNSSGQVYIFRP